MPVLFDADVTLEKFPGKGGWTYAPIGKLPFKVRTHFGVVKVNGLLDGVAFENRTLMSMGQGQRFVSVSAELRKQLGKQAGDVVRLRLELVEAAPTEAISMADLEECLAEQALALQAFRQLMPLQREKWLTWVQSGSEEQRIGKVETALVQLAAGQLILPSP